MVVDCGGGTVDIITYRFVKPLAVHEAVPGRGQPSSFSSHSYRCALHTMSTALTNYVGALCGGLFVAERFKELVINKFEQVFEVVRGPNLEQEMQKIMARDWEEEIRNEIGGPVKTWTIGLPISLANLGRLYENGNYPAITITSEEVEEVFRPSVEKIVSLITSQIDAATKKGDRYPKVCNILLARLRSFADSEL